MRRSVLLAYIAAFLFVGIASIFVLHRSNHSSQTNNTNAISSYIVNAEFTEYDKKGQIKVSMIASKITRLINSGETQFTQPRFVAFTQNNHTPWHIRADAATSDKNNDKMILKNNVVIHALPTAQEPETTITTTELTIFLKKSTASTEKPVTIQRPGILVHGTGFTANLKTGEYQLRSESSATLQPQVLKRHKHKEP